MRELARFILSIQALIEAEENARGGDKIKAGGSGNKRGMEEGRQVLLKMRLIVSKCYENWRIFGERERKREAAA